MKKSLDERLEKFPELRARFEAMLDIAEDADGDLVKADDTEERVISEMQKTGHHTLTSWAETREAKLSQQMKKEAGVIRDEKKS
jgi:hypothetical protein